MASWSWSRPYFSFNVLTETRHFLASVARKELLLDQESLIFIVVVILSFPVLYLLT